MPKKEIKVRVNDEETAILRRLASDVPENGLILEIGCAWGHSCKNMLEASNETVNLVAIDPWTLLGRKDWVGHEKLFLENIEPFKNRVEVVKAFSQEVDVEKLLNGRGIDLLFIDGDHHRNAVRDDYLKYHKFVKPGGVLVFHDYDLLAGVTKAVNWYVVPSELWEFRVEERLWIGRLKWSEV